MSSIYTKEKNLDKRVAIHSYTMKFNYLPDSFTLFGSNNHICWFIIDEVFNPVDNIIDDTHISRNITNNIYFRYFKLEAKMKNNSIDHGLDFDFDEKDFNENLPPPIKNSNLTIEYDQSNQDFNKQIGLLETLIFNNFHTFITVHQSKNLHDNTNQSYSIFSNYIRPKLDLNNLDPRPKGRYEFIFHSFYLQINSIFFKNQEPKKEVFLIDYLNSGKKWCRLINTQYTTGKHQISTSIYGIRFNTNIFGLNDFDFFGQINFSKDTKIIPSSYSAFPFWGSNLNGIIDGIQNYTLATSTKSGLFEIIGQLDNTDGSQKSFMRGMNSSFDEYTDQDSSITFHFQFKVKLSNYIIQVPQRAQKERNRNPHKWKLEGSNDEKNWVLLDEVEDNIFDTETEAVVYRTKNTSDYFSYFKITKFDDFVLNDNIRFNQLILYEIEFFGIISPFYSEPSFFLKFPTIKDYDNDEPDSHFSEGACVQPIVPIDLCNGILGCFNYYGGSANQKANRFKFDFFIVNLVAVAIINPSKNLILTLYDKEKKRSILNFAKAININDDIIFFKLDKFLYNIVEISLSQPVDGIELFGFISDYMDINYSIVPSKSIIFPFNFNFKSDILHSLISSEFPNNEDIENLTTTFFKVKTTESMKINDLPCQIINSPDNDNFALFDFIDSCVSLNFFIISCSKLESLKLEGSNDGEHFEDVLDLNRVHRNYIFRIFLIKSKNQKHFRYFRLFKIKEKGGINFVNFYGNLKLIKPKLRPPFKLSSFENLTIQAGLDCQNGIMNAFKNIFILNKKSENTYLIDFVEISVVLKIISLISFNDSNSHKNRIKMDFYNEKKEKEYSISYISSDEAKDESDAILYTNKDFAISSIEIMTNMKKFDFDKIEFFGDIILTRSNPIRKKPSNFNYLLNPLNGILNSGYVKFRKSSHFHYIEYEFDKLVFLKNVFIEFEEKIADDFFIEAAVDALEWKRLDLSVFISSSSKVMFNVNESSGFRIFHLCNKSNVTIKEIEFFGRVDDRYESNQKDKKTIKLFSNKATQIEYDINHPFCGIFYSIKNLFGELKVALSTRGTAGNESDEFSLFDCNSTDIIPFTSNHDNSVHIYFKFAHVKLSQYLLYFGPDLIHQDGFHTWNLEGSNDSKTWTIVDARTEESSLINAEIDQRKANSYSHYRFVFQSPCILRKIDFFGNYIPVTKQNNIAIIKNHPVFLRNNPFAGILHSMCRFTNVFEKKIVKTNPEEMYKIFDGSKSEEVVIEKCALFEFYDSELILNYYSIETTMKNWSLEVNSLENKNEWVQIHSKKNNQDCNVFKISNCPPFNKIRFVNNDKGSQKVEKIDFFGTIIDKKLTKSYRYDLMNGLLSLLANEFPNAVFDRKVTVKSSDYKYTNPIQLFDRSHINRIFCFLPSQKEDNSNTAFVTFEFWQYSIQIDKYSLILFKDTNFKSLKIEGGTSLSSTEIEWKEIDFLNEKDLNCHYTLLRKSKTSLFFHFIRISSNEEFAFENIEFFGDYKSEELNMPMTDMSIPETKFEVDAIAKFPPIPSKLNDRYTKSGFFRDKRICIDGFIQIESPSSEVVNSKQLLSIFQNNNSKEIFCLSQPNQSITINFLTTSFQLTHFYIECLTEKVALDIFADNTKFFSCTLNKANQTVISDTISLKDLKILPLINPTTKYEFNFSSSETIKIRYIEFFGNLMPLNNCPNHLLTIDHNYIALSFKNESDPKRPKNRTYSLMNKRKRMNIFKDGVINFIFRNYRSFDTNGLLSIFERYPAIQKHKIDATTAKEFSFGNSPQVTFDFGFSFLLLEKYAIESGMKRWMLEGSANGGKTWFLIDLRYENEMDAKLFSLKKPTCPISQIRLSNMDSLFESLFEKVDQNQFCGIKKIEFFGDFVVRLPKQVEEKVQNDSNDFFSILDDNENEIDDDDSIRYHNSKPQENLIFFPKNSFPCPKQPKEETKKDLSPRKRKNHKDQTNSVIDNSEKADEICNYEYEYEYEYDQDDPLVNNDNEDNDGDNSISNELNFNLNDARTIDILNFLAYIRQTAPDLDDSDDDDSDFSSLDF